jgi:hypothetical protein
MNMLEAPPKKGKAAGSYEAPSGSKINTNLNNDAAIVAALPQECKSPSVVFDRGANFGLRRRYATSTETSGHQGVVRDNRTNVQPEYPRSIQGIPEGDYYAIQDHVGEALSSINHARDVRTKRAYLNKLREAHRYILRASNGLMPWFNGDFSEANLLRQVDECLQTAKALLNRAIDQLERMARVNWASRAAQEALDIVFDANDKLNEAWKKLKEGYERGLDQKDDKGGIRK